MLLDVPIVARLIILEPVVDTCPPDITQHTFYTIVSTKDRIELLLTRAREVDEFGLNAVSRLQDFLQRICLHNRPAIM